MDGLQIEEATRGPHSNMHQHLHQKMGKSGDLGQKTPLRGGLGLMVNESKTPGAKSLQGVASARKATLTASIVKKTIPYDDEYEVYQDEPEEEVIQKEIQPEARQCASPIDIANRCEDNFDSLGADIVDDMLNWQDQNVELCDELPLADSADSHSQLAEQEALASLGIEEWDEYPDIEIASRIADDFNYPMSLEEFRYEDVDLEEGDYQKLFDDPEARQGLEIDRDHLEELLQKMREEVEEMEIDEMLGEQALI